MRWIIFSVEGLALATMSAALAFVVQSPVEAKNPDEPHRPWGQRLPIDMSLPDAQNCIAREMDKRGNVLILPRDDGADIDWNAGGTFWQAGAVEAGITFQVRHDGSRIFASALYRHPFSAKKVTQFFAKMKQGCLRAGDLEPLP